MKFRYGDSWEKYPISENEIWQVGDHVVACGDIEDGAGDRLLTLHPKVDFVFIDPPWNKGNARAFRTKADVGRAVDFPSFVSRVVSLVKVAQADVLIEFGGKGINLLTTCIESTGGTILNIWDVTYYSSRPCKMVQATWGAGRISAGDCTGMDEMKIPEWFFTGHGGAGVVLFDPCMGQGLSAVTAVRAGMQTLGLELNKRRAAVTLEKLAKLTGDSPRFSGRLG